MNFRVIVLCAALIPVMTLPTQGQPIDVRAHDWRIIDTGHYQVIFPAMLEERGQYVASSLEYLFPFQQDSLDPDRNWRFPVILNPEAMTPNGFVSTHPRRSVFYTIPDSGMPDDWFAHLAVHEGRHMFQLDAMNRHFLRGVYCLFGENAFAAMMPKWWFEGDAVMAETVMSPTGRGRDPSFTAPVKALLLEDRHFSYDTMIQGSYDKPVPDAYAFGYLMYAWLRDRYRYDAPEVLFESWSRFPLPALGPHIAMKNVASKGAEEVWDEMYEEYRRFWLDQTSALTVTPVSLLSPKASSPWRLYPLMDALPDGRVAAQRVDSVKGSDIVLLDGGRETVLCAARAVNSLRYGGGLLVWDEIEIDPKFLRSRTRITAYDLESGNKRVIARSSRYIGPTVSPDGTEIAAVEWLVDSSSRLAFISPADGSLLRSLPVPDGELWFDLRYSDRGNSILFVSCGVMGEAAAKGKELRRLDLQSGRIETLVAAGMENIRQPVAFGSSVFYVSGHSGIDTVYERGDDGRIWQVLVRPIGASCPVVTQDGTLVFVDYADSSGQAIAGVSLASAERTPLDLVRLSREEFFLPVLAREPGAGALEPGMVPSLEVESKPYDPGSSGNRVYSWGLDLSGAWGTGLGLHAASGNITGIRTQTLGAGYDYANERLNSAWEWRYRAFAPDIVLRAETGAGDIGGDPYNETGGFVALELPVGGGAVGALEWVGHAGISAGGRIKDGDSQLPLDVYGGLGISLKRFFSGLDGLYEIDPVSPSRQDHWYARYTIALPGIFARDQLSLTASREVRDSDDDSYTGYVRGAGLSDYPDASSGSALWSLPLFYPDVAIGSLAYLTMIRLCPFYDCALSMPSVDTLSSVGAEVLLHFTVLQLPLELSAGIRYAWIIEESRHVCQFVFVGIPF